MVEKEDVKVLGTWGSSHAMRPRIALNMKKVEYEFIAETMNPKSELLLKSNPIHKKISVFFHKGTPICESLLILEYIDETWTSTPSLLPTHPYDRAQARFWASYIDQKWYPRLREILMVSTEEELAAVKEQIMGETMLIEEAFGICSKGGKWFGGEVLGYLDIVMGCFSAFIMAMEKIFGVKILDGEKIPLLTAWADRFCAEEAVKEVMPDTEKLVAFAKIYILKLKAASAAN